jgi:hypothetical protein
VLLDVPKVVLIDIVSSYLTVMSVPVYVDRMSFLIGISSPSSVTLILLSRAS